MDCFSHQPCFRASCKLCQAQPAGRPLQEESLGSLLTGCATVAATALVVACQTIFETVCHVPALQVPCVC